MSLGPPGAVPIEGVGWGVNLPAENIPARNPSWDSVRLSQLQSPDETVSVPSPASHGTGSHEVPSRNRPTARKGSVIL
jgi:hypothetical protein